MLLEEKMKKKCILIGLLLLIVMSGMSSCMTNGVASESNLIETDIDSNTESKNISESAEKENEIKGSEKAQTNTDKSNIDTSAEINTPKTNDPMETNETVGGELDYDGMMSNTIEEIKNLYNQDDMAYEYIFSKDGINLARNYVTSGNSRGKNFSIQVPKNEIPKNMSFELIENETPYMPLPYYNYFLSGAKSYILDQWPFMDYTFMFTESSEEYARKINMIINKAFEAYDERLPGEGSKENPVYLLLIPLGHNREQFMFAEFEVIGDSSVIGAFSIFTTEDFSYYLRTIVTLE